MLPIALIGAGPLGLEIAVALQRASLPYIHFEAAQIGATMQWWPQGTRWFSSNERISIAGVPLTTPFQEKATREEYLAYLRAIVEQFDLAIQTYTKVTHIARNPDATFTLTFQTSHHHFGATSSPIENRKSKIENPPQSILASKVILATGGTASPNLLNIPGENLPHVSHYFHDPHTYFRKSLHIVGGKNSAVEAALRCHRAGAHVSLSYRGSEIDKDRIKYWLYPEFASLLKTGKITAFFATKLLEITPKHVLLEQKTTHSAPKTEPVSADFVLLLTGYQADMSLAQAAGITLQPPNQIPLFNPETMESNIPGLYVAGTAIAGTQTRYRIFLENCHIHVPRILNHLINQPPPPPPAAPDRAES